MNINMINENSENKHYVDALQSHHFLPAIPRPTRFPPNDDHSPSLLDHIWLNSLNICNLGIIYFDLTDHCPTFLQFPLPNSNLNNKNDKVKITFRLNNERIREKFRQSKRDFDWNSLVSSDMNDYVGNFSRKLNNLYCSAFPIKSKHIPMRKVINP